MGIPYSKILGPPLIRGTIDRRLPMRRNHRPATVVECLIHLDDPTGTPDLHGSNGIPQVDLLLFLLLLLWQSPAWGVAAVAAPPPSAPPGQSPT